MDAARAKLQVLCRLRPCQYFGESGDLKAYRVQCRCKQLACKLQPSGRAYEYILRTEGVSLAGNTVVVLVIRRAMVFFRAIY